jgi:membrane fusion protein (multidrug efflux system)
MIKALMKVIAVILLLGLSAYGTVMWSRGNTDRAMAAPSGQGGQTTGTAAGGGRTGGAPQAIPVDIVVAASPKLDYAIRATGNLVPNETVEVTPEQSRRLAEVVVQEGALVNRGDVLFRLDASDLVPRLSELEARLERARREEQRQRELLLSQAISQSSLDEAATEVRTLTAQIAQVKDSMARTEIRAPFKGRVGLRRVSPGAWVTPGTVLTTLSDVETIKLDFKVPERYANSLPRNGTVRFRVEGGDRWLTGTITAVEPLLDQATRSVMARAVAKNEDGRLQAGAFVNVEVPLAKLTEGVMVPSQAIVPSARGLSVFVEVGGKAVPRSVRTGVRTPDAVQVLEGLAPGDRVIASNLLRMRPNVPVRVLTVTDDPVASQEMGD